LDDEIHNFVTFFSRLCENGIYEKQKKELIDLKQHLLVQDDIIKKTNSQTKRFNNESIQMMKEFSSKSEEIIKLENDLNWGISEIKRLNFEISQRSKNERHLEIEIDKRNLAEKELTQKVSRNNNEQG
jgi:hypothetical protein